MEQNIFFLIDHILPWLIWVLGFIAYSLIGVFILIVLDDVVLLQLNRSVLPTSAYPAIFAWTIWPLVLVVWLYRVWFQHRNVRRW